MRGRLAPGQTIDEASRALGAWTPAPRAATERHEPGADRALHRASQAVTAPGSDGAATELSDA